MLLASAAALVLTSAAAEPPRGPKCPPGQEHCWNNGPQNAHDQMGRRDQMDGHNQMSGPGAMRPGAMSGPAPKPGAGNGPAFRGGPGGNNNATDWHWQDNRGGWHRDHDRYWQPGFRGGFAPRDRLFLTLRQHNYNRFDGDPYWYRGRFVVRSFDRRGRAVMIELNPYTGAFIGIARY
jgi:hypothetical protein